MSDSPDAPPPVTALPTPPSPSPALAMSSPTDEPLRRAGVEIRPSTLGGRGVFTRRALRDGALIEECPVLLIDAYVPELDDYIIRWGDTDGEQDDDLLAMPLGYGACYNHAEDANAYWDTDQARSIMIIWAARDIAADEEITISYGSNWFPGRGLSPKAIVK